MNTLNPYLKQYKKNQIETATPEQILILLYDGAINFLNRAKFALEENDDEQFHKGIISCKKIIIEFMDTLDMERGGKLAATLYSLYKYYRKILTKAEVTKNVDGINEVLRHLIKLRETWQKAIEIANSEKEAELGGSINTYDKYEEEENDNVEYEYEEDGYNDSV